MKNISIVIPFFNRKENINLVLKSLTLQTDQRFEVILFDDGSTDNPNSVITRYRDALNIKTGWQENKGYRVSRARNLGCKIATTDMGYLFLDSDVVLNKEAVAEYYRLIEKYNNTKVICGEYRWMPPMIITEGNIFDWTRLAEMKLPRKTEGIGYVLTEQESGREVRKLADGQMLDDLGGVSLSGNLYVPKKAFEKTGGFDEIMVWHGQDSEFGHSLTKHGYSGIYSTKVYGLHIHHSRDQKKNAENVLKSIEYIHNVKHTKKLGYIPIHADDKIPEGVNVARDEKGNPRTMAELSIKLLGYDKYDESSKANPVK